MNEPRDQRSVGRPLRERLIGLIRSIVGPPLSGRPIPIDARLRDLGMTSIHVVSFMLALEAEFGLSIPEAEISPANFRSVATIEALIGKLMKSSRGV